MHNASIKRVGVIGGGQLAWMMAPGAKNLGLDLVVQTPKTTDPAASIATEVILAGVADPTGTAQLAQHCDVITFENEFVDLPALERLATQGARFYPPLAALAPLLDKYDQRQYCNQIGLPSPPFVTLNAQADLPQLAAKVSEIGLPLVLKTRRHGYDGQGTFILKDLDAVRNTWERLNFPPVLLEAFVPFERELAVMVARSLDGQVTVFPVVETQQIGQVCRRVIAPARVSEQVRDEVVAIATTLVNSLQVVGIFGIELFLAPGEQVLVNEIAPRTHNSGHYTLDACTTSQFEQQLRAVAGMPLGSADLLYPQALMINLLGYENTTSDYLDKRSALAAVAPNAHLYWYGKTEARIGRKLGHITLCLEHTHTPEQIHTLIQTIESLWYPT
jgi:5-(carboxyamino)imidazole ribonucleotide synthase